jgi:hypothetical protein
VAEIGSVWLDGRLAAYPALDVVVRGAGLKVRTWDGSGGFEQLLGVVVHHTASPPTTSFDNDWSYCAVGHQDAPVANMLLGRDGTVGIHAGGASNHAGKGGPWAASKGTVPLDSGNSRLLGIEAQNAGTGESWAPVMVDAYERLVAALSDAYGFVPATDVPAHFQWAPTRKIDPWGGNTPTPGYPYTGPHPWTMAGFTANVAARMGGQLPPPEGDLVLYLIAIKGGKANAKFYGFLDARKLGHSVSWVRNEGEYAQYERLGAPKHELNLEDLAGLYLVGPLPQGDHFHTWTGAEFRGVVA